MTSITRIISGLAVMSLLTSCQQKPEVVFLGHDETEMFQKELFAQVDGVKYQVNIPEDICMTIVAQEDFDGDGVTDALIENVQACGGNAIGNAFFFVTYQGNGTFAVSDTFGSSVYEEPVIEKWEGNLSVVINDSHFDEYTEEFQQTRDRYVLCDGQALKVIEPNDVSAMPDISVEEWAALSERADTAELTTEEKQRYQACELFDELYSGYCSWYCGGEVQQITASSCRKADGEVTYEADNAHDFNHESVWATAGQGIGESLVYTFAGVCPRITTVRVFNGDVKSEEAWRKSSRAKLIKMYINDKAYAILSLEDSRSLQDFEVGIVGFHDPKAPDWTLKFEILDVFPGNKYKQVVIAELFFDGIDVH